MWLHFTKIDANSARCNICQKVIAAKASNTTNLMNYLTVHKINLRERDEENSPAQGSTSHVCLTTQQIAGVGKYGFEQTSVK